MAPTYAPWHAPRKKTYEAWRRARKVATAGEILVAWEAYTVEWATWPEDARKFVPAETKWLDEKRWRKKVVPRDAPSLGSRVGGREQTVEDREEITRRTMAALRGEGPPVLEGRVVVGSSGHSPVRRAVG